MSVFFILLSDRTDHNKKKAKHWEDWDQAGLPLFFFSLHAGLIHGFLSRSNQIRNLLVADTSAKPCLLFIWSGLWADCSSAPATWKESSAPGVISSIQSERITCVSVQIKVMQRRLMNTQLARKGTLIMVSPSIMHVFGILHLWLCALCV